MIAHTATEVKASSKIGVPFIATPTDLMARTDLSLAAKAVFSAMANHARMKGSNATAATNAEVAAAIGMSVSTVRRALDALEEAGLIERRYEAEGRIRTATVVMYGPRGVAQPRPTPPRSDDQPGRSTMSKGVAHPRPTPHIGRLEEREKTKTGSNLSTNEGRKTPEGPALPQTDVAAGIRAMLAGTFTPIAEPPCPAAPTPSLPESAPSRVADPSLGKPILDEAPAGGWSIELDVDLKRVGYAAAAAAGYKKKTEAKFTPREGSTYMTLADARGEARTTRRRRL